MEFRANGVLPLHIRLVSNTLAQTHVLQFHIYTEKASKFLHFWCLMPKGETVLGQSKRTAPALYFLKNILNYFFRGSF
jgi:hypothetical protein